MSISFNSNNNIFNKPLDTISGSKAVIANQKDKALEETQKDLNKQGDISNELETLATKNRLHFQSKQESDSQSDHAASSFEAIVASSNFTPEEVIALYGQFDLQVSNLSPEAKQKLDITLSKALFKAFKPIVKMDNQSRSAIDNFKSAINSSLTRDEMVELFTRFSREISINFPEAWKELENILSNNVPSAFKANTNMDAQSKSAIINFKSSVNPDLTKDEMIELFTRFSREISVKYPAAWKELSNILADSLSSAFVPNNSMDSQSKSAISNFRSTINPDLTRDEMVELFTRFSREISIKFPAAWKQLESVLNNNISSAFKLDNTMDGQSRNAIANFKSTINSSLTQDEMVELFTRFSREISINFPQAWKELESKLAQEVPNAFKPVTTIDETSKDLAIEFINRVDLEKLSTEELDTLFGNYLKQISLKYVDAKKEVESAYQRNINKSVVADKTENKESESSLNLVKDFSKVVNQVNYLDEKVRQLGDELASADNKEIIKNKLSAISQIEGEKDLLDSSYKNVIGNINSNNKAVNVVSDDYKFQLDVSKARPSDKKLQQKEMKQVTRWDMLRNMRRKEVLGILKDQKKDNLVEQLIGVPKFILKKILLNQVHDNLAEILMEQRYPEALLREIPRSNAKKQLPKAEDMLPVMMMSGKLSNGQTGIGLIRSIIVGDFKAEKPQNQTRAREELVPFVADMLLNKPPKVAELLKSTESIGKPKSESFNQMVKKDVHKMAQKDHDLVGRFLGVEKDQQDDHGAGRRDNKVNLSKENKNRLPRLELLSLGQLLELARDKVDEFTDDESNKSFRAKRGTSQEIGAFLECLDNVSSLADAKLAVALLYNNQQQVLKQAVLPHMDEKDMVKITLSAGKDKEQMVKDMPWYTIQDQIKALPKVAMVDSFKKLDKSEILGAFKQLPSQVIASIAFDAVDRNTVSKNLLNQKGFAAA